MNIHSTTSISPVTPTELSREGMHRGSQRADVGQGGLVYGEGNFNAAVKLIESSAELGAQISSRTGEPTLGTLLNAKQ